MIYISGHIRDPLCRQACPSRVSASGLLPIITTQSGRLFGKCKARLWQPFPGIPVQPDRVSLVSRQAGLSQTDGPAFAKSHEILPPQPGGNAAVLRIRRLAPTTAHINKEAGEEAANGNDKIRFSSTRLQHRTETEPELQGYDLQYALQQSARGAHSLQYPQRYTSYADPSALHIMTLDAGLYLGYKNDVAFA